MDFSMFLFWLNLKSKPNIMQQQQQQVAEAFSMCIYIEELEPQWSEDLPTPVTSKAKSQAYSHRKIDLNGYRHIF